MNRDKLPPHPTGEIQAKRPYSSPRLIRLGSIRELTLGGATGAGDGAKGTRLPSA